MGNGRTGSVVCRVLAASGFIVALAQGNAATAAAVDISTTVASTYSARPIEVAAEGRPIVRGEAAASKPGFQTPIAWHSGLNIAGSRTWTKVIKFSSNGINIRLPLN
jgi:hypothetical protein